MDGPDNSLLNPPPPQPRSQGQPKTARLPPESPPAQVAGRSAEHTPVLTLGLSPPSGETGASPEVPGGGRELRKNKAGLGKRLLKKPKEWGEVFP